MKTSTFHTYEPEDLERLMRTKSFEELLPEERAFVLRHVESSEEYGQVRQLMIEVEGTDHDLYDPPAAVWKNLQREFRNQKKSLFVHWLNVLAQRWSEFTSLQRVAYSGLAMAAVVTLLALPYYQRQDAQLAPVMVAENKAIESVQPELKNSVPNVTVPAVSNQITESEYSLSVTDAPVEISSYPADEVVPVMVEKEATYSIESSENKVATTTDAAMELYKPSATYPANATVANYTFSNSENLKIEATTTFTNANVSKSKAELAKDSIAKIQSKSPVVKKKKKKKTH